MNMQTVDLEAPALDDVMLAMDVVDTLRHEQGMVEVELGRGKRDEALLAGLRDLYASQGLAVTDEILEAGIAALHESRFTYRRRGSGFWRGVAGAWMMRRRIGAGIAVALVLAVGMSGLSSYRAESARQAQAALVVEMEETLPREISRAYERASSIAVSDEAVAEAARLKGVADAALALRDGDAVRRAVGLLGTLERDLRQVYTLRIVSDERIPTGVFRVPDANQSARNHYVIVEAIAEDGSRLSLPVLNEETNRTETVAHFGVRVPEDVFEAVRRDKMDDGIVQNNRMGAKPAGHLAVTYEMPVLGGMITRW